MGRGVALVVLTAALVATPAAVRASGAVTVVLTGTSQHKHGRACGTAASFAQYRVGGHVGFRGTTGVRGRRRVRIVVKRCFGSTFGVVKTLTVRSGADGRFRGRFAVHVRSDCYVQAHIGKRASRKAFFAVR